MDRGSMSLSRGGVESLCLSQDSDILVLRPSICSEMEKGLPLRLLANAAGRETLRDWRRLKRQERQMKYLVLDWILDGVGSYKEYFRDNWIMFQMNDLLDHFIVSMLTFLSVMPALWLYRNMSLFLGRRTLKHLGITCHDSDGCTHTHTHVMDVYGERVQRWKNVNNWWI